MTLRNSLASAFSGFANDLNFFDATVQQWNFDIQREVVKSLVAEVSFAEWTRDGSLRHAAFVALRDDKPAGSVVREG